MCCANSATSPTHLCRISIMSSDTAAFVTAAAAVAGVVWYAGSKRAAAAADAAAAAKAAAEAEATRATAAAAPGAAPRSVEAKREDDDFSLRHDYSNYAFGTRAIHVGQEPDSVTGAVSVPISMASTFAQKSPGVVMVRNRCDAVC